MFSGIVSEFQVLSAPKSQRFLRFAIAMPIADPRNRAISETRKAMLRCDLRVRWKVASDLRFRAAISEPKTPSFCGISGDLAPSTRKSLAIAIVRFWCAKGCFQGVFPHPLCGHPFVMPKSPESEILAKFFAGMSEKRGENSAKNVCRFSFLPFPGKEAARNFTKNPRQIPRTMK